MRTRPLPQTPPATSSGLEWKGLSEFIAYALTKPDVRVVASRDVLAWIHAATARKWCVIARHHPAKLSEGSGQDSHLDLAQGRHALPDVESIAARRASERNIRGNAGGRYVKLKIVMADAKATAPSVRADGPDDAEARCGHQYGAPRGWWVSFP